MKEISTVRQNLMDDKSYTGYCGSELCKERHHYPLVGERWPRTEWNGEQFTCPKCKWTSQSPKDFIKRYKDKWRLN